MLNQENKGYRENIESTDNAKNDGGRGIVEKVGVGSLFFVGD